MIQYVKGTASYLSKFPVVSCPPEKDRRASETGPAQGRHGSNRVSDALKSNDTMTNACVHCHANVIRCQHALPCANIHYPARQRTSLSRGQHQHDLPHQPARLLERLHRQAEQHREVRGAVLRLDEPGGVQGPGGKLRGSPGMGVTKERLA